MRTASKALAALWPPAGRGVKAFGEPPVDGCQQRPGFRTLALLLPQPRQAHRGAQFQRLGLLVTGTSPEPGGNRFRPRLVEM